MNVFIYITIYTYPLITVYVHSSFVSLILNPPFIMYMRRWPIHGIDGSE